MDALSILARVNSQLSSGQEGGSRRRDSLRPRSIIDVDSADSNELFITIHCGGVPQRYDSTTVIIFHTRRNVVVPSAPENVLLDRIKAWPNSDLNDSLLSIVDGFIERIPRFYETATRITMVTDRKGVTDYTNTKRLARSPILSFGAASALSLTELRRTAIHSCGMWEPSADECHSVSLP